MLKFSKKASSLLPSATAKVFEEVSKMKSAGDDIVDFTVGQPYFDFSDRAKRLAAEIIKKDGNNRYAPNAGLRELRQAIAGKCDVDFENVFVSAGGAKQAIHLILEALIDPGEGVVIFSPYWTSYPDLICLAGGIPKPFYFWDRFNKDEFKGFISGSRARVVILNNPVNPTGVVWSAKDLYNLGMVAIENDLIVISDEVYDNFIYGNSKFTSLKQLFPREKNRFITVNSFSKTYAMMGYRIGYVLAEKDVVLKLADMQSQVSSAANTFGQRLALSIMKNCQDESLFMVKQLAKNRDLVEQFLRKKNIGFAPLDGAFYAFLSIMDDDDAPFWQKALKNGVGVIDGSAFGCPGHIRICYAQPQEIITKGLERIANLL